MRRTTNGTTWKISTREWKQKKQETLSMYKICLCQEVDVCLCYHNPDLIHGRNHRVTMINDSSQFCLLTCMHFVATSSEFCQKNISYQQKSLSQYCAKQSLTIHTNDNWLQCTQCYKIYIWTLWRNKAYLTTTKTYSVSMQSKLVTRR